MSEIQDGGPDSVMLLPCVVASEARMLRMRVKIGPSLLDCVNLSIQKVTGVKTSKT